MFAERIGFVLFALTMVSAGHAFDLQGHRGARGLAPENTLAGFERALEIGVTTLEMDVAVTADGVVVASHDPALNPAITRDAAGRWLQGRGPLIHALSYGELRAFDVGRIDPTSSYARRFTEQVPRDGERVPTLAAVFARVNALGADGVRFNIETKIFPKRPNETLAPEPFVRALLAVVREAGIAGRVTIQSFDWRTLQLAQRLEPGIPTSYLTLRSRDEDTLEDGTWTAGMRLKDFASVAHMVKAAGGAIWSPAYRNLSADAVKTAHDLGLKVVPWTVNDTADAQRLIDWGVDGIISDHPERIREVMRARGLALPAPLRTR